MTGKFGTGFLTTHLLSEQVKVYGVAKEPGLDYRKFNLELNRSGFELQDITQAVQNAKDSVQNLDEAPAYEEYNANNFNTSFTYPNLDKLSQEIAKIGLTDLQRCIIYTFAFVKEVNSIEISHLNLAYENSKNTTLNESLFLFEINQINEENSVPQKAQLVLLRQGFTTIAVPIKKNGDKIHLLPINTSVPRLFCDFPLIGTENFPFPVIINNPNFNPTDPRDGIFLNLSTRHNPKIEENKTIINEAKDLFEQLLHTAITNNWENLHLLAQIPAASNTSEWLDKKWFNSSVSNPIREKLLYSNIVKNALGKLSPILTQEDKNYIWFPSSPNKKIRKKIWDLMNHFSPKHLPHEQDIDLWHKLGWPELGKLNIRKVASIIQNKESIEELKLKLEGIDVYDWLHLFYEIIELEEDEYDFVINNYSIFPNQNGYFSKKSQLYQEGETIEEEFKTILTLLKNKIKDNLLDNNIQIDFEEERIVKQDFAIKEIKSEVNEKANDRELAKDYIEGFKQLLLWFKKNPQKAKNLFPHIYKNKHILYDDEEIMENILKAEEISELLDEYKLHDIEDLRDLLDNQEKILPVTQEILLNMGISSIEEWQEAIQDKNLAKMFEHKSVPTEDMFIYAQTHIKKAKENIIKQLEKLSEYDLTNLDDTTAPTILAGIIKNNIEISVVARPAYNGEVIIYYGSEQDVLDYEPSELWIDDGGVPRKISLGHILKKAQIVKFPI